MLSTYQAIVTGNHIQWQDTAPNLDRKQVIITVLPSDTNIAKEKPIAPSDHLPSYAKGDFSFDLKRMQDMMDTDFKEVPKEVMTDLNSFENWIKRSFT